MISFDIGEARFNYRVVGIALEGDRVLLHRAEMDDFWSLPGGRGEMLEPSEETLKREMREELSIDIRVDRLVWVVENFFEYDDKPYHELAFYFLMTLPPDCRIREKTEPFAGYDGDVKLIFKWYQLDKLKNILLYPSFLREGLSSIPESIKHIVHIDP